MQLSDIREQARIRSGVDINDATFLTAALNGLVNAAVRKVNLEFDWVWQETTGTFDTVAGSNATGLSSNLRNIRWMRYEDRDIKFAPQREVPHWFDLTGEPQVFTEEGGSFSVYPTPDAVYTISYGGTNRFEAALVNDTDVPSIPDWAIELVILDTARAMCLRARDTQMSSILKREYDDFLRVAKDENVASHQGRLPIHDEHPSRQRI